MNEYHINDLNAVSIVRLEVFQEKVNGNYMYDKLIVDEGYRGTI